MSPLTDRPTDPLTRRLSDATLISSVVFGATFGLYLLTLAPSVVIGDPGEYQTVPHVLGIAHPPGYLFYMLLAKLWTTLIPIGGVAYRTNLLSAAAGAWTVTLAYRVTLLLTCCPVAPPTHSRNGRLALHLPGLYAAAILATATDLWQHSIHANAHVVSAALSATTLWAGLCWWKTREDNWLYLFAGLAALGVAHHPLLAFGAPVYLVFVLALRPRIMLEPRALGRIALVLLVGLSVFLYLPLRAGATPFGPNRAWDDLWAHATARGIRVNLFHYDLGDQPVRARVFWDLLELQYPPIAIALALLGLVWLARLRRVPLLLLGGFLALNYAFIINTVQDVMAYLMLVFTPVALFAGAGVAALINWGGRLIRKSQWRGTVLTMLALILSVAPGAAVLCRTPRLSLRNYRLADQFVDAVFERFEGRGEGAVLLAAWEWITPLEYAARVQGRKLDPADVKLVHVSTAKPWPAFVWEHIDEGPIYLADYRPQVTAEGFRLRPVGDWPFYQLLSPPATQPPEIGHPLDLEAGEAIQVLGWDLDRTELRVGQTAYLTLYMRAPAKLSDYYMPFARLGGRLYRWTTDSRLNTPWWEPGEIIVERYPLTIPFGTVAGDYPLALGWTNVSQGQDLTFSNGQQFVELATLQVEPAPRCAPSREAIAEALANVNSQIILTGGRARARGHTVETPWADPLLVRPGDSIQVWLDWRALAAVDQSYTVFVHLTDGAGRPWAQHDYTPMGGAFPTFLWIPKWIEGQTVSDPYELVLPPDVPPGDYVIEIGMYDMTSLRRAYHFDPAGNLAGDRYIMGPVRITRDAD